MKLGVDLSILDELLPLGPRYEYRGEEVEPFAFFASHSGISMTRLRLWVDPYDEQGNPYGGGTNDLPAFIRLAKKAIAAGMEVLLDFHYSDFWVDPSRQIPPKAWRGKPFAEVVRLLYEYTRDTLMAIRDEGIDLAAIQVGNEITQGMLYPYGEIWAKDPQEGGGYDGLCELLKAGFRACKEIFPHAKRVCHLEHSGSNDMQDPYFENLLERGVEFEVIGESYYPYWHGTFDQFEDNVRKLKAKYGKEIWVVEAGYEYAESRLSNHHQDFLDADPELFRPGNLNGRVPFPLTQQGQADYFRYFLALCKRIGVGMVFYWEPAWVYVPDQGWAKEAGQVYCGLEPGHADNDWENETLFDFEGRATLAVDVFTQDFVDSL